MTDEYGSSECSNGSSTDSGVKRRFSETMFVNAYGEEDSEDGGVWPVNLSNGGSSPGLSPLNYSFNRDEASSSSGRGGKRKRGGGRGGGVIRRGVGKRRGGVRNGVRSTGWGGGEVVVKQEVEDEEEMEEEGIDEEEDVERDEGENGSCFLSYRTCEFHCGWF